MILQILHEIQVVNDDDGPAARKPKLGKFLGKKYGIGVMLSDSSWTTCSNSVSKLSPLEKANTELVKHLQYPQLCRN